jgi:hypothetical protein
MQFSRVLLIGIFLIVFTVAGYLADNRASFFVYTSDYQEVIARESVHKNKIDRDFSNQHLGKMFLQIEENGEAWYISPEDGKRYYLGRPDEAFAVMRELGLKIATNDLKKIPEPEVSFGSGFERDYANKFSGKILLQFEEDGEAWYINPADLRRYYLGCPADAYAVIQNFGVAITNEDLRKIPIGDAMLSD